MTVCSGIRTKIFGDHFIFLVPRSEACVSLSVLDDQNRVVLTIRGLCARESAANAHAVTPVLSSYHGMSDGKLSHWAQPSGEFSQICSRNGRSSEAPVKLVKSAIIYVRNPLVNSVRTLSLARILTQLYAELNISVGVQNWTTDAAAASSSTVLNGTTHSDPTDICVFIEDGVRPTPIPILPACRETVLFSGSHHPPDYHGVSRAYLCSYNQAHGVSDLPSPAVIIPSLFSKIDRPGVSKIVQTEARSVVGLRHHNSNGACFQLFMLEFVSLLT